MTTNEILIVGADLIHYIEHNYEIDIKIPDTNRKNDDNPIGDYT